MNSTPVTDKTRLKGGDVVSMNGITVTVDAPLHRNAPYSAWSVLRFGSNLIGINRPQFTIGGRLSDDILVAGLPPAAITLHTAQQSLLVELSEPGTINGEELPSRYFQQVYPGDQLTLKNEHLTFYSDRKISADSTEIIAESLLPIKVTLTFKLSGGELQLEFIQDQTVVVELTEMRASLIAILLSPPGDYKPGELVPDDILASAIWPRQPGKGRTDINLLIHRVRKNLLKSGLNAYRILERARTGNATRFALAPQATVQLHV